MKTLGLIGGISWVSTVDYYKYINEGINAKLGGSEFARLIIHSLNYGEVRRNNENDRWDLTLKMLVDAALNMKAGGAQVLVLCANTMHRLANEVEQQSGLPVIHIAKETAAVIAQQQLKKVALLGTKFTMEMDFFHSKLAERGIEAIIPGDDDRAFIHHTIFEELGSGILLPETKARYQRIIADLQQRGAQGVILGCTEIPLLIHPGDVDLPTFDTTKIHADAAVRFALS